ncbi:MAG TPA: hypothetical protein PKC72_12090, partial [Chitinophagaceae bacterium]|nr:hypothetical protein [Chitinophagaceae bacterium]
SNTFKRHPWELARLKILLFFLKQSKRCFSIVDIGSGDAFLSSGLAHQLPDSRIKAFDINYSEDVLNELSVNVPSNVCLTSNFDSLRSISTIDAVILMDVLEHIEQPKDLLHRILKLPGFTEKTKIIITVPAYQKLFSRHDKELGHFRRYNIKTLESLLQSHKLKLIRKGYCFNSLLLVRIFQFWSEKFRKSKKVSSNGIHKWNKGKPTTSFITSVFWIEFKISWYLSRIGIRLPGLTCYSICQLSQ